MNGSLERVHAFCDDALGKADATEVARRIRQREISVKEAVSAAIQRAERLNPRLTPSSPRCSTGRSNLSRRLHRGYSAGYRPS